MLPLGPIQVTVVRELFNQTISKPLSATAQVTVARELFNQRQKKLLEDSANANWSLQ
jgi:hypothetical protein